MQRDAAWFAVRRETGVDATNTFPWIVWFVTTGASSYCGAKFLASSSLQECLNDQALWSCFYHAVVVAVISGDSVKCFFSCYSWQRQIAVPCFGGVVRLSNVLGKTATLQVCTQVVTPFSWECYMLMTQLLYSSVPKSVAVFSPQL